MEAAQPSRLRVERALSEARRADLGIPGWPTWKEGEGDRVQFHEAAEQSYFLAGSATLTPEGGEPATIQPGDLVLVPSGHRRWQVHETVRRHYRVEALTPACCTVY